jgi:hypothetical protein
MSLATKKNRKVFELAIRKMMLDDLMDVLGTQVFRRDAMIASAICSFQLLINCVMFIYSNNLIGIGSPLLA